MQHSPQPGQILHYEKYRFLDDGSERNKFFIIIYVSDITSPCLLLKTTSKERRYTGSKQGCNRDKKAFYIPKGCGEYFKKDTYIQLPEIIPIDGARIFAGTLSSRLDLKIALTYDCFRDLMKCLRKFREDISERHWNLLFNK
jgi:hypothetical protein